MVNITVHLTPALTGIKGEMWVGLLVGGKIYWYYLIDTPASVNGLISFGYTDQYPISPHQIRFPEQTINGITYLETQTPEFSTAYDRTFNITLTPAAPAVDGRILVVYYWIEGMAGWAYLNVYPTPAKVGDEIHLGVGWVNDGSTTVVGNVYAQLKSPTYYAYPLDAVAGQDHTADPSSGFTVQFAPFTLNESGSWEFYGMLTLDGEQFIDFKKFTFTVEAPVGIPTTTTISAPDKVGVGEKFNISGILYEKESGIPIPNHQINHSYNGRSLGTSITGIDGDYLKEVSIPYADVWTLRSDFLGTAVLQTSRALVDTVVAATPTETALLIAGPIATGIALFIYGTM